MIRVRITSLPLRGVCWDLENRPSAYWYDGQTTSEITAFGWKWLDEKHVRSMVLRADGRWEDETGGTFSYRRAHELFGAELASAGFVYGHNIRRHDLPMLGAWRLRLQLPPLEPLLTSDTCRDIPRKAGLSVSLENLAAMYALPLPKHRMTQPDWERSNQLRRDGLVQTRKRVEGDVLLQEAVRGRLIEAGVLRPARTWKP